MQQSESLRPPRAARPPGPGAVFARQSKRIIKHIHIHCACLLPRDRHTTTLCCWCPPTSPIPPNPTTTTSVPPVPQRPNHDGPARPCWASCGVPVSGTGGRSWGGVAPGCWLCGEVPGSASASRSGRTRLAHRPEPCACTAVLFSARQRLQRQIMALRLRHANARHMTHRPCPRRRDGCMC